MMNWHTPDLELFRLYGINQRMGSDGSLANIYLLKDKYDIEVAIHDGVLYRYYNGKTQNRRGYGFPLSSEGFDLGRCMKLLSMDADRRNVPFFFCLCDEWQAGKIDSFAKVEWLTLDSDSDYIYERSRLVSLDGEKLRKKRNHIHHFQRTYPDWRYEAINVKNYVDVKAIADRWFSERQEQTHNEELENRAISLALDNWEVMGLFGGILYVGDEPAAMTIASLRSDSCVDVHFEKAAMCYAQEGAYAVINHCFASSIEEYSYVNREEDMGVEGLRYAKRSYDPFCMLQKYYGECVSINF